MMKIKRKFLIGAIILWMITIFCFSNQVSITSSKTSGNTIKAIINLIPNTKHFEEKKKEQIIKTFQPVVRKLAHFSIYALGGILFFAFYRTFSLETRQRVIYAMLSAMLYAGTDEFHQLFVHGRSAEVRDVWLDTLGAMTGIVLYLIILKIGKKRKLNIS